MAIDYDAVRETLWAKKRITGKKYAEYRDNEDALREDLSDAKTVFALGWDGNFPGNSGAIWIEEVKGLYFCSSTDFDSEGPFQSLGEALGCEFFHTSTPNPSITSDKLPLKRLLSIGAGLVSEEGEEIDINSKRYVLEGDKLVRVKKTE